MRVFFSLLLVSCFFALRSSAQIDTSHLRVSLLTVGPGHQEIYEPFGHTGLRIVDSFYGTDIVYNYGTFHYNEPNFELNFMRGKLLYYLSTSSYQGFVQEYIYARRKVEEQVFDLTGRQKLEIQAYLHNNLRPENSAYKYDFFFDNCATRIRDIFPRVLGDDFKFAQVIPVAARISYREIINQYLYKEHLYRFGINILLGSKIDAIMSNEDIMFLPDYLRDGLAGAKDGTQQISTQPETILMGDPQPEAGLNYGVLLTLIFLILTAAGLLLKPLHGFGSFMSVLVLTINTLLGLLIMVMWLGTDHQACRDNWNILWALPTGFLLLGRHKGKARYALVCIVLIVVSLLLHVLKIQELPLMEIFPWLLSLLLIYGTIYRRHYNAARV